MMLYGFRDWANSRTVQLRAITPFEPPFEKALGKIREGWNCVDVGAATGYYTIKMAQLAGPQGKVLAIEPHPEICTVLARNIRRYGLHNVAVVQKVVDRKKRKTRLFETGTPGGTYALPLRRKPWFPMNRARLESWVSYVLHGEIVERIRQRTKSRQEQVNKGIPLNADKLDNIIPQHMSSVDLIKMDIQGMEFDALKGARQILDQKPLLLIEMHPSCWYTYDSLCELLRRHGYSFTVEEIDGRADVFLVTE